MSPARLSPGRMTALWIVLRSVARLGDGVALDEALTFARRNGLRSGGLPIEEGYRLAALGGFLTDFDPVHLTALGKTALLRCTGDEPNAVVLRLFASTLLLRHPPAWVAYWQGDPENLDIVLPDPTRDVLREADLLREPSTDDLEVWAWWDAMRHVPLPEETAGLRKATGDAAENLSMEFERTRLRAEGYPALADQVRCVARESAAYGFDILSFCGATHYPQSPTMNLAVEVKGMALVARSVFRFYLTHHEWKTAATLGRRHVFHLCDGVHAGPDLRARRTTPIVVLLRDLESHVPLMPACHGDCHWESSLIAVPA